MNVENIHVAIRRIFNMYDLKKTKLQFTHMPKLE